MNKKCWDSVTGDHDIEEEREKERREGSNANEEKGLVKCRISSVISIVFKEHYNKDDVTYDSVIEIFR